MSALPVLQVDALVLHRGDRRLAGPLDLQLHAGSRGLLRGGNGSGKTTFMHSLAGLLPIEEGSISVQGRVGYAMQEPRFPEDQCCATYLRQLHALLGGNRKQREEAVSVALERFQLQPYAKSRIGNLSRGWRQRLNLARAWLGEPQLLLLDEPQTALDPDGMRALAGAIDSSPESAVLIVAPEGVGCDTLAPEIGVLQDTRSTDSNPEEQAPEASC